VPPKEHLIWDLSGTLFMPSKEGMSPTELADYSFLFLMWSGKKEATHLDTIAFQVLTLLNKHLKPSQEVSYIHTGAILPEIVRLNLAGMMSCQEALTITLEFFSTWAPQNLSKNDAQQVRIMLEIFFNPNSLARCMKPLQRVVDLLLRSAEKKIPHYILSNWDKDSFAPFYHIYKDSVLASFSQDHIVISADTGYVKPDRNIYSWFLTHKHLDPGSCLFLDDQLENIEAAASVGIEGLHIQRDRLELVTEGLQRRGLI